MLNHFNFKKLKDNTVLVTNDFGRYEFLTKEEFECLTLNNVDKNSILYSRLHEKLFILEPMELHSHEVIGALQNIKNYIFQSTSLHIFVVTNQCNLNCVYCQAQDHKSVDKGKMSLEVAIKAINIALESPNDNLSFEFQGGEPLLNFPVIKNMIEYTEEHKGNKNIEYTLVSNFALMTDEIADFLVKYHVQVCTSLDGPEYIHLRNRVAFKGNSYKLMQAGMSKLHNKGFNPGAIQTTTKYSLPYAKEIVREYLTQGMSGIFIRPLTPLGFAKTDWDKIGYTADEFLDFYKAAFREILEINKTGHKFTEQHAVFFLRKILAGMSDNYMELRSPCGAGIGQLAYYFNGDIYTCDEARMVAEAGNQAFKLGNVFDNNYKDLVTNQTCKSVCSASILESIPGCCDCVYHPYCGVCPVINYALYGNMFTNKSSEYRCKVYGGILNFLFDILKNGLKEDIDILKSWVGVENEDVR